METKEFYTIVSRRSNVSKILDFALPKDTTTTNVDSQNAAFGVLTQVVQQYLERKKEKEGRKKQGEDEDEETTLQQLSEDEGEESGDGSLIEVLVHNVPRIVAYLDLPERSQSELSTSYDAKIQPLGSLRLKVVELVYQIIKLNKDSILTAIGDSTFFEKLSTLIEAYPWNNFLHLKVIAIYEDVFESSNKDFIKQALTSGKIGETLITLAGKKTFQHESNRSIRQGYMAVVVKLANTILKYKAKEGVQEYLTALGDDWRSFVEGELKQSNDVNTRSLGGQQPRQSSADDDDVEGSMSMDSILQKFQNFSTERSKRENSQDDDDEDEEEDEEEDDYNKHQETVEEQDEDRLTFLKERDSEYQKPPQNNTTDVENQKEKEPLVTEFVDSSFWKVNLYQEKSLDEMMAEMNL